MTDTPGRQALPWVRGTDSAWSDVAALSGTGPDHPPAVGSGIGDGQEAS